MFVCVQERDTVELLDEDSQSILNIIKDTSTSHSLLSGESHDNHMTCATSRVCRVQLRVPITLEVSFQQ